LIIEHSIYCTDYHIQFSAAWSALRVRDYASVGTECGHDKSQRDFIIQPAVVRLLASLWDAFVAPVAAAGKFHRSSQPDHCARGEMTYSGIKIS
jgi:hypothetical protein